MKCFAIGGPCCYGCQRVLKPGENRECTVEFNRPDERSHRPCSHLGEQVRLEACLTCGGNVKVKVYACDVHKECTLKKCVTCPDHSHGPKHPA